MGILIQGIEMPKDDEILCINIKSNGDVYYNLDLSVNTIANAIRIPPHGRLIDADELAVHKFVGTENDISFSDGGACYRRGWDDAIEAIMENAETIIGEKLR
ncbi:MAG: hypothetical protein IJA72_02450 [Clostridia bacterium]|nr:hypothetical protein [Clostridia bacterium]